MEYLDGLRKQIASLPKREKTKPTNWYEYEYRRAHREDPGNIITIRLDYCDKAREVMSFTLRYVPKGTYLGAILKWFSVPHIPGATLKLNGTPCNLAECVRNSGDEIDYS